MVDVIATLYDGSYHDVDSNEMALDRRSMAFKEGRPQSVSGLLEPVMAVEVVTPEDYARSHQWATMKFTPRPDRRYGASRPVAGDQSDCRWRRCSVMPHTLRSSTQGRAGYSMHFAL